MTTKANANDGLIMVETRVCGAGIANTKSAASHCERDVPHLLNFHCSRNALLLIPTIVNNGQ